MRSLAIDYRSVGDKLWDRFNAPKEGQAWYYGRIQDSLWEMQNYPETEDAYWEFARLYKDVFVEFYLDEENGLLFQSCTSGTVYCLEKGNPRWRDVKVEEIVSEEMEKLKDENPKFFDVNLIANNAQRISRKEAELMEDMWNKPFWDCNKNDMSDGEFILYHSKKRNICVKILRGRLSLMCEDYGKECLGINGSEEYEFSYTLDEDSTKYFLVQIRIKNGIEDTVGEMMKKEFGNDSGSQKFKDYCDEIGVKPEFYCG